jgi:hypothetical protein
MATLTQTKGGGLIYRLTNNFFGDLRHVAHAIAYPNGGRYEPLRQTATAV